jgi:hypothetical protein
MRIEVVHYPETWRAVVNEQHYFHHDPLRGRLVRPTCRARPAGYLEASKLTQDIIPGSAGPAEPKDHCLQ